MFITNYKFKNQFIKIISNLFALIMNAIDLLMRPLQKIIGVRRMPYIFLLPNLIFFGLFVIIPLVVNIFFSLTGGTELYISNRDFSGLRHYQTLFDCQDYFNPNSCNEDYFWRGINNTITFVFFQVILMIFFSLLTGVILNKNIIGLEPLADKWRAFNWHVLEIDGHNMSDIEAAFVNARKMKERPTVIIAHTLKGKGVSYMEGSPAWHGSAKLSDDDIKRALLDLVVPEDELEGIINE